MESYLRGVVPAEVPAGWPTEALKAQAIAARSYSAVRLHPDKGTFDVYDDTRSQVYLGKSVEKAATDAAIAATAQVVIRTPGGKIASALFHSTGGGATENNEFAFVSSTGRDPQQSVQLPPRLARPPAGRHLVRLGGALRDVEDGDVHAAPRSRPGSQTTHGRTSGRSSS